MVAVQLFSWKPLILPSKASSRPDQIPSLNRRLCLHSLPLGGIDSFRCRVLYGLFVRVLPRFGSCFLGYTTGTFRVKSQGTGGDTVPSNDNLDVSNDFNPNFHKSLRYKLFIGCIPLYAVFRIMQKIFQELPRLIQSSSGAGLAFACASNSLNKPTPLKLDVSLPAFQDVKWSIARFLYLFNVQLEKNVATFLVVLLISCISFVAIGGILFFKFRKDDTPLEQCFWEAWACLISSSTHLKVMICVVTVSKILFQIDYNLQASKFLLLKAFMFAENYSRSRVLKNSLDLS
ncbi:unnamed protein product [Arabis nemorensis]|uniref:Uncharacterized protein n=1 Tax=Arabis nemorensis TaxID=586526 RepID=A0A565C107_9BRAS|nr:unnamed protein product [Arabis nemorensis]